MDGTTIIEYHVVCPYSVGENNNWYKDEPEYNFINGQCVNSITTDYVFDSFEDAKAYKNQKNEGLLRQELSCLSIEKLLLVKSSDEEKFAKKASFYQRLEEQIEEFTKDLMVNSSPKEQRVIHLKDKNISKTNGSLYEMIPHLKSSDYIVYSVTYDQYIRLQELSADNIPYAEFNHTPLLINSGKLKTTKVVSPSGDEIYLINNELVSQSDEEFMTPTHFGEVFYTIETYEDIIKSFRNRKNNNNVIRLVRRD